jgi:predicted methyltransferase
MNRLLPIASFLLLLAINPATAGENRLEAVLDAQPDEVKARYQYRHPQETIEFFGIEPGMTIVEGLPGRGWYTKLLLPYLGTEGHLVGANYPLDLWPNFPFATEEFMAEMSQWLEKWPADAEEWRGDDGASIGAFWFGAMPGELAGTVDAVFFVRMLHNVWRFQSEGKGDYLDMALADAYNALKPGGVLGVVQHHARDDKSDEWANGSHGYMKKQFVIDRIVAAGFEFVAESDINANDNDQPTEDDIVWRLPPTYATSGEDSCCSAARTLLRAAHASSRMPPARARRARPRECRDVCASHRKH